MTVSGKGLEKVLLTRVLRLNSKIHGGGIGLLAGLALFVATNWLVLKGGAVVGPHLSLLGQYFIGYRVTFVGSLIGFAYAFVSGFVVGYGFASLYNVFADLHQRRGRRRG